MALNSDFKVKDSLYIGNSAYFTGCTNTDGEILSAGLPLASLFVQQGEVAANCDLTTGTGITNVTYDGTSTQEISIASACDSAWNGKTTCTGTTTPTSTETFTNKCGSNSQWVNDEGYTNCVGDITEVTTTGDYLSGGGTSGAINIGLQSGCAEKWDNASAGSVVSVTGTGAVCSTGGTSPVISIDSACDTKWDQSTCAGIICTGTTTPTSTETFTNKCGSNNQWVNDAGFTTCTGTTTPSNTQTFTNKSGSNSQWTNDLGYTTCTGDITEVSVSTLLSGGGTAGCVSVGIDSGALDYLNQSACAGLTCVGTLVTADISGLTCCTGTVTSVGGTGGIGSTGGTTPSLSIDAACNTKWDQSACVGITCVGTITEVTTCAAYLTGGGTSGSFNIGIDSACGSKWDSSAAGTVTTVTGGDGVNVSGGTTPTVCVDTTVARTDVAETFTDNVTIQGNLTVDGTTTTLNTLVETTSAFTISNHGTGPALSVEQTGTNNLATFTDSEGGTVCINDGAKLKITPSSAADAFCVGGDGRITGDTILNGGLALCGVSTGTDDSVLVINADGSVSTDEIILRYGMVLLLMVVVLVMYYLSIQTVLVQLVIQMFPIVVH